MALANAAGETADPKEPKDAGDDKGGDDALNKLVNSAVSSHLKRHLKGLEGTIGSLLEEKLAGLTGGRKDGDDGQPARPAKGGKAPAKSDDDEGDGYNAKSEIESLRNELKAERAKMREKEVLADVKSGLAGKVKPEAVGPALRLLRDRITIKGSSVTFKNDDGESVDLDDGIAEWLKSPEGALFATPPTPSVVRKAAFGAKAPHRPAPTGKDEDLTPAQKTARDFARLGL